MSQATLPLERYKKIVEMLASGPHCPTRTQITQAKEFQSSSAHRLVNTLSEIGLAERRAGSKSFVLESRVEQLCRLVVSPISVGNTTEPELYELVRECSETAYLAQLKATTLETVAMPDDGEMTYLQPRRVMPIRAETSAKAILAHHTPDFVRERFSRPLEKYTEYTPTDPQNLVPAPWQTATQNEHDREKHHETQPGDLRRAAILFDPGKGPNERKDI